PQLLNILISIGSSAIAAGIDDLLLPYLDCDHVLRQFATRIPKVDLEGERVAPRARAEHPFERRIRDQAAVPKIFVADLGRRETRRQRTRGGDMFESDLVRGVVEIGEIAAAHFDRADAKAHLAGIDTLEIDQTLECRTQQRVVVIARSLRTAGRPNGWRWQARHKEIRRTEQQDIYGTSLIEKLMLVVAEFDLSEIGYAEWRSRHCVPKFAQRVHPLLRRIAGDDRRVNGADRDSGNPVGMQIGLDQCLINARLISPERAAPL